jgi:hypothetical protein
MSEFHDRHAAAAIEALSKSSSKETLKRVLRQLAKHRTVILQYNLVHLYGTTVHAGPFKDMIFSDNSTEGCLIPKLLGCYEMELHPFIEKMHETPYNTIINVGSAEGYYATGFKRLFPEARVIARDTDPAAQVSSKAIAEKNGVSIEIGGEVTWDDFEILAIGRTLVWCDIEGAERSLLDPEKAPKLKELDLVIECHSDTGGHLLPLMVSRFQATHDLEVLTQKGHVPELPEFALTLDHLDQLLMQWEFRSRPTPWIIARAKRVQPFVE